MARQQRKPHQQQEQITEERELVAQMCAETRQAGAVFKAGKGQFVSSNDPKTGERNGQGVPMKQRDPEQGQRKQDEIKRDSED